MEQTLGWLDVGVFLLMLLSSLCIGLYWGCCGGRQARPAYLLGDRALKAVPVGLSLMASHVSGMTVIGVPAEVYTDNATYWILCLSLAVVCFVTSRFFLPVICNSRLSSAHEYLELRFSKTVRSVASGLFVAHCLVYLPWVVYVPALALNQMSGINLHVISMGVTTVCVFYTMIGGLKAVVWTDFLQTVVTVGANVAIVIIATSRVGGLQRVMELAAAGGKLNIFNMDPNPFMENTFWTVFVGSCFSWTFSLVALQGSFQRFLSVPSLREANVVLLTYWAGMVLLVSLSVYGGLLMYAAYLGCDPIDQKLVTTPDQMFPYFVLQQVGHVPALPGLFVAGVFSAALSSQSAILNTLAGTIYEDYVKKNISTGLSDMAVMKIIIVLIGIFSVLMVAIAEKMGKVIPVSYMICSITGAPLFSLFLLGMLVPFATARGALVGAACSGLLLTWLTAGASLARLHSGTAPVYPNSTCHSTNSTSSLAETREAEDVFILYKLSYMYLTLVGSVLGTAVGCLASLASLGGDGLQRPDPLLISPPLRRFLPKKLHEDHHLVGKDNSSKIQRLSSNHSTML